MEIAASVASVTGILAFAGQALSGLMALKEFVEAVKHAPEERDELLDDIQALHRIIDASTDLISQCTNNPHPPLQGALTQLSGSIQTCSVQIDCWRCEPKLQQNAGLSNWRGLLQRINHAGNKEMWQSLSRKVSAQRERISLELSFLGRWV